MSDRGSMDISAQQETYSDFVKFAKYGTIAVIIIIAGLAIALV